MKKFTSLVLALCMCSSMFFSAFSTFTLAATPVKITQSGPWVESGYAMWEEVKGATGYNVYYKHEDETAYTQADAELIRGTKVDLPGLIGKKKYEVKVVPVIGGSEDNTCAATTYFTPYQAERSGYAFSGESYVTGGYNKDGTIPENAEIVYVDKKTMTTMKFERIDEKGDLKTYTGLKGLLQYREKAADEEKYRPLIVRFIGSIPFGSNRIDVKSTGNITFEGVGNDAVLDGWGIDVTYESKNVEIRNLTIDNYGDDGIQVNNFSKGVFIHNNTFGYGFDGACDVKNGSDWITISYNISDGSDKNMLCGHGNSNVTRDKGHLTVTYHHNWFKGTKQRNPRVRFGKVHVYNNYYDGVTLYGVGSACDAQVLVENNYFYNTVRPYIVSQQGNAIDPTDTDDKYGGNLLTNSVGGYLKAVGNYIDPTCTLNDDTVDTRLDNWDFDPREVYSYSPNSPQRAREKAIALAGVVRYGEPLFVETPEELTETTTSAPLQYTKKWIFSENTYNAVSGSSSVERTAGGLVFGPSTAVAKSSNVSTVDGGTYKNYVNFSGAGSTESKYIKFITTGPATFTVYADGGSSTRNFVIANKAGNIIGTLDTKKVNSKINKVSIDLPVADTYYVYAEKSAIKLYAAFLTAMGESVIQTTTKEPTTQATTNEVTTKEPITQVTTNEITTQVTTTEITTTEITTDTPVVSGKLGDVNSDGTITASDAANILAYVLNSDSMEFSEEMKTIADVNKDLTITAVDAANVLSKVLDNDFVFTV